MAFESFRAGSLIISREILGAVLKVYIDKEVSHSGSKNIPKQKEKLKLGAAFFESVYGLGLIKSVIDIDGLLRMEQEYEFLHLTFQEYYVAIYLAEGLSNGASTFKHAMEKVILKEKYNPRWQIVWWFVAGFLRENPSAYKNYLEQLQGQCNGKMLGQDIFEHYQLGLLARCVDEGFASFIITCYQTAVRDRQLKYDRAKNAITRVGSG